MESVTDSTDGTDQAKEGRQSTTETTEDTERVRELAAENARLRAALAEARIEQELVWAAEHEDAVNPAQVAKLMKDRVRTGEDLKPVVVDAEGNPAIDEYGQPVTVADAVRAFLDENPHLVSAPRTAATGKAEGGSLPRTAGGKEETGRRLTTGGTESTENGQGGRMKDERRSRATGSGQGRRQRLDSGLAALTGRTPALTGGELIAEGLREEG